jgi:nitroimidazol reductase NimA-like FMN-containing flavoprotein (pyridoxamine 5'-phosphate oxidase superfamily)
MMFREMRRIKQLMPEEEAIRILKSCSTGVLAVSGDDGYPYTVPLNYTYEDGRLLFHCALVGHKIDAIKANDKVTFCVIERDDVVPDTFSTNYRSVVVFGRARILGGDDEKRSALEALIAKYSAGFEEAGQREIEKDWNNVALVEVKIEHITGKVARALVV